MVSRTLLRRAAAPLYSRLTYRRWAGLIVGGGLLMPYMMAGEVAASALWSTQGGSGALGAVDPAVFLAVLPVIALSGLVLPVRAVSISAARALFGVHLDAPEADARTWPQRRRTAAWFTALLGLGGIVSGLTLAIPPFAVYLCTVPFAGDWLFAGGPAAGWSAGWLVPLALGMLVALVYFTSGVGALLARLTPGLLGPTPEDKLAAAELRSRQLAERNRLARELHDSVGHALSVVTLQAAAAGRVLDADPAFARRALGAIEESARTALEDLDYVLGVLREEGSRAADATLSALDDLVAGSGMEVDLEVVGPIDQVPRTVSREAYRIVQEGLTNVLRHGAIAKAGLRVAVSGERLEVTMTNPVRATEPGPAGMEGRTIGGGRGLRGMRERVALLRGELTVGVVDGEWRLAVRLPVRASAVRP